MFLSRTAKARSVDLTEKSHLRDVPWWHLFQRTLGNQGMLQLLSERPSNLTGNEMESHDGQGAGEADEPVHEALRSQGQPLDASTRAFFEPRFGRDFSQVRLHTDKSAALSARKLEAQAYTVGNQIVFASGRYAPNLAAGRQGG